MANAGDILNCDLESLPGYRESVLDFVDTSHVDLALAGQYGELMFWAVWKNCHATAINIRNDINKEEGLCIESYKAYKRECRRRGLLNAGKRWDQLTRTDL